MINLGRFCTTGRLGLPQVNRHLPLSCSPESIVRQNFGVVRSPPLDVFWARPRHEVPSLGVALLRDLAHERTAPSFYIERIASAWRTTGRRSNVHEIVHLLSGSYDHSRPGSGTQSAIEKARNHPRLVCLLVAGEQSSFRRARVISGERRGYGVEIHVVRPPINFRSWSGSRLLRAQCLT